MERLPPQNKQNFNQYAPYGYQENSPLSCYLTNEFPIVLYYRTMKSNDWQSPSQFSQNFPRLCTNTLRIHYVCSLSGFISFFLFSFFFYFFREGGGRKRERERDRRGEKRPSSMYKPISFFTRDICRLDCKQSTVVQGKGLHLSLETCWKPVCP